MLCDHCTLRGGVARVRARRHVPLRHSARLRPVLRRRVLRQPAVGVATSPTGTPRAIATTGAIPRAVAAVATAAAALAAVALALSAATAAHLAAAAIRWRQWLHRWIRPLRVLVAVSLSPHTLKSTADPRVTCTHCALDAHELKSSCCGSLRIVTICLLASLVVCGVAWAIIFRRKLGCHLLPRSGFVKVRNEREGGGGANVQEASQGVPICPTGTTLLCGSHLPELFVHPEP